MYSASASALSPPERASFSTSSRLLSCLITESLLKAVFVPICSSPQEYLAGTAIVFTPAASKHEGPYTPRDIFAVLPLRHIPIFKPHSNTEIGLLDPLDMLPYVYELPTDEKSRHGDTNNVCCQCHYCPGVTGVQGDLAHSSANTCCRTSILTRAWTRSGLEDIEAGADVEPEIAHSDIMTVKTFQSLTDHATLPSPAGSPYW